MEIAFIYKLTNLTNNKVYIGSTKRAFRKRKSDHVQKLRKGKHYNFHLQASWNKYGEKNFKWGVIKTCKLENRFKVEEYYIKKFKSVNRDFGYNLTEGCGGKLKWSKYSKDKVSKSMKEYTHNNVPNHLKDKISLKEWKENKAKGLIWVNGWKVKSTKTKKIYKDIIQIDRQGDIVKIWSNTKEINKAGFNSDKIVECIKGFIIKKGKKKLRYSYKDFKWVTKEQYNSGNYLKGFYKQKGEKQKRCTINVYYKNKLINTYYRKKDFDKDRKVFTWTEARKLGINFNILERDNYKVEYIN